MEDKIQHSKPVPPFVRFCAANIPMVFDDSLSYYECLCALWNWLQTDVINVINNNATVTQKWREELTEFEGNVTDEIEEFESDIRSDFSDLNDAFDTLKTWVETYFDNLDVQQEINNKLDEMADQGVLADIISQYLNSIAVFGYDTVASMKASENLIEGSYARTMGYHTKNDGGAGTYKIRNITNEDVVDEGSIIAIGSGTLVAELIKEPKGVNVKQFGAYGDDTHDDSTAFQNAINSLNGNGTVYVPSGTYVISDTINTICTISIIGEGEVPTIRFSGTGELFNVAGHAKEDSEYYLKPRDVNAESKPIFAQLALTTGELHGRGKTDTIAISFDTTNDTIQARGYLHDVQIWHFDTAILIGKYHFYLMKFERVNITYNNTGIKTHNDRVDSGEKISIIDSLFDSNYVGIDFTGADYDMNICNTSIDYNDCFMRSSGTVANDSRKIVIDGCHYETNTDSYTYNVNNPHGFLFGILYGTSIFITNSKIVCNSGDQLFFAAGKSGGTYVHFENNRIEFVAGDYNDVEKVPSLYYFNPDENFIVSARNNDSTVFCKPLGFSQAINFAGVAYPYATGSATVNASNILVDSSNQATGVYIQPDTKVNVGSYNITSKNSRTGYKGIQFIPTDNTQAVQVVVADGSLIPIHADRTKRVCIAATNCSKVEYQIGYYNESGTRVHSDSWYTSLENNTIEDKALIIPHCPAINKTNTYLNDKSIKVFVKLTGIVGKTPELNALVVYTI